MFSGDDKLTEFSASGLFAGFVLFLNGLRIFRKYRAFARTREAPIRGIPRGLIGIRGKAKPVGNVLENSPLSHTPCLFFRVDIEKEVLRNWARRWSHYKTTVGGMLFHLDDGTGRVLVNPFAAECDLLTNCTREAPQSASSPPAPGSISDAELIAYAGSAQAGGVAGGDALDNIPVLGLSTGRYRFSEYCILPEREYHVAGTCVENPQPKDSDDRNMIVRGQKNPMFLISWRGKTEEEEDLRSNALYQILGGAGLAVICLVILSLHLGWL